MTNRVKNIVFPPREIFLKQRPPAGSEKNNNTLPISEEEERLCHVGRELSTLNRCIQEYLPAQLKNLLENLSR
jgi:hypothetical protein